MKQQRGKIRQDAKTKVSTIWQKAGLMEAWQEAGWLQGDREGWNEEWGYVGMVPKSVIPPECVSSSQTHAFMLCTLEAHTTVPIGDEPGMLDGEECPGGRNRRAGELSGDHRGQD